MTNPLKSFSAVKDRPYSFFLDSGSGFGELGRRSFFGSDPFLVFKSKRDNVTLEWPDGKRQNFKANPFLVLKSLLKKYKAPNENKDQSFTSGAVGYFAYDLKDFVEDLPYTAADDLGLPDCILGFYDSVTACDNLKPAGAPEDIFFGPRPAEVKSNFSKASYMRAIEKAKAYIKKGDIYQVNLSQRFEAELNIEPFELYSRLRSLSPAPFSSYLDFGDVTVLSSSPERFLLKRGDYIETRPIKGTRPRGEDGFEDSLLAKELIASAKDRAEHIMIVDLERNDLGRVSRYGSVRPTELFALEKYANVFHLVSTVAGRLRKDVDPIDCLLATFPGGSVTGAPKIRSMEIIEELEPVKRGIYTGAIGYISFDGNMDTSIVIRTFVIKGGKAYFSVGGGIVADSDPEKEYEETLHKAKGLMGALGYEKTESLAEQKVC